MLELVIINISMLVYLILDRYIELGSISVYYSVYYLVCERVDYFNFGYSLLRR